MSVWPHGDGEMAARIRAHDWATTPLGPVEAWPQTLRSAVDLLLAHGFPMIVLWGPDLIQIYNDGYRALMGIKHPAGLGQPTRTCWPEVWHINAPIYERVWTGETVTFEDARYPITRSERLEDAWFTLTYNSVRDEAGGIAGLLVTVFETTGRVQAALDLRASEGRFRAFVSASADVIYRMSPDWSRMHRLDGQGFLADTAEPSEGWMERYIHPDDQPTVRIAFERAIGAKDTFELEHRVFRADGTLGWTLSRAVPILDGRGEIAEWLGTASDVTERRRSDAALLASQEQRRIALDGGRMGTWRWDLANRLIWGDARFLAIWGLPPSDEPHPLALFTARMSPEGAAAMEEIVTAAIAESEEFDGQLAIVSGPTAGRWIRWRGRADDDAASTLYGVTFDVTEQRRMESALRESEEQQAFLLKFTDALRPLTDTGDVERQATRLLGEHLDADRCFLSPVYEDGTGMCVREEYLRSGASSVLGDYTFAQFGDFVGPELHAGRVLAVEDVAALTTLSADERASYAAVEIGAYLLIPLVRDGRLAAFLTINHRTPRTWSDADKAVARQTADRLWAARERGRAEAALRESEERFAQFAASSSDALWIREAATLTMEYVSPAIQAIYGVPPDHILGDPKHWAALVVPEDRDAALGHLEQARRGETVVHEFRIQRPSDGAFRWIRDTDFPLHDDGHVQRIGGIAQDVTEAKLSAEHQGVLLAELQHRVRNIMAVIRAITARTGERAASVPEYASLMAGRLLTLARVQALLTRAANAGVGITEIVRDELDAQAHHKGQYSLDGPDLVLSPKAAEVLTLAVHELTTNALKYGALSKPHGHVSVRWATFVKRGVPWLGFDWTESGAPERPQSDPSAPRRRGFGSELIEGRVPYELGGRGKVVIEPGGARCRLEFPLRDGDSILETDAPRRVAVFGGSIDMTGEADLSGRCVLVVEDDYYLATDTARALEGAGAEMLGPCPTEETARDELDERRPDAAVVDVNLGSGPSFELAKLLKDRGIPFVFTTGYDLEVIPAEFAGVERLQKPVQLRQIVAAVSKLLTDAA